MTHEPARKTRRALLAAVASAMATGCAGGLSALAADPLPSWQPGPTRDRIVGFVREVTDPASPRYVPVADRLAVFDNDGTLWCEQPLYVQALFIADRIRELAPANPEWQGRDPFRAVLAGDRAALAAGGERALMELAMATHAGMTVEAFSDIASRWLAQARHPRFGLRHTQLTYAPMLELLRWLRSQGFRTAIATGGGVEFVRTLSLPVYGIAPEQVVGSSIRTRYAVIDGQPALVRHPEIDFVDDRAGKPVGIFRQFGQRPIAAFGNSDGDYEMLEWTTAGSGARLGVLIHHDDEQREYAYDRKSAVGRLDRGLDDAPARGWVVSSMRRDWRRIFA